MLKWQTHHSSDATLIAALLPTPTFAIRCREDLRITMSLWIDSCRLAVDPQESSMYKRHQSPTHTCPFMCNKIKHHLHYLQCPKTKEPLAKAKIRSLCPIMSAMPCINFNTNCLVNTTVFAGYPQS
jgi:hypothetical protein